MHKNKINISEKTFQNNINKITKLKNLNNKLQIKLCNIPKNKSRQKENSISINRINKLDYKLSNTYCFNDKTLSLNFNKSNYHILNKTDFDLKESLVKNNAMKTLNNENNILIKATNIEKLNTNKLNKNKKYNKLIKNGHNISSLNEEYLLNNKNNRKVYSSLNKNKQNININNNIIININSNNNQYERILNLNNSTNKHKAQTKSRTKNNSQNKTTNFKSKIDKQVEKIIQSNKNNFDIIDSPKKYIKLDNVKNGQIPKDYLNIIYYNLLQEEQKGIKPMVVYNYMADQNEINEQMRSILIDWLIDVHHKFQFRDETLFMTVLIIDRFCTIRQISRARLQLLGITAMMIACKHEEIELPKMEDFIYITDNAYTKKEIVKLENDILIALNFELLYPSPIKFYEYLSVNFNFDKKAHFMGKYLMETFLLDIKYVKYKASVISCACVYIVMKFFKMERYQESYEKKFFLLNENEDLPLGHGVKDCAQDICILVDNIKIANYLSCFKKYSKDEFNKVALLIENKN